MVASAVVTGIWLIAGPHASPGLRFILLVAALVGYAAAVGLPTRFGQNSTGDSSRKRIGSFAVVAAIAGMSLLITAVVLPPRDSADVWSYAMYGRMVATHHVSPYTHEPLEFANDPVLNKVPPGWRHVSSVYGPAFTTWSAGVAYVAGSSLVAERVLQQGLAAISVLALAMVLSCRQKSAWPYVFLCMNPAVIAMVNGGHNDVVTGVLAGFAVMLAQSRKTYSASAVFGLAMLVKAFAFVPFCAVAFVMWHRYGSKQAARFGGCVIGIVVLAYEPAGGTSALRPLFANNAFVSRASIWSVFERVVGLRWLVICGSIAMFVGGLVWRRRWFAMSGIGQGSAGASVILLFSTPYLLPWYCGLTLPLAALLGSGPMAAVAAVQAEAVLLAYVIPPGHLGGGTGGGGSWGGSWVRAVSALMLPVAIAVGLLIYRRDRS